MIAIKSETRRLSRMALSDAVMISELVTTPLA